MYGYGYEGMDRWVSLYLLFTQIGKKYELLDDP